MSGAATGLRGDAARVSKFAILAALIIFILAGTLFGALSSGGASANHDTLEAYVWGHEFQLGYYKHPPFWAWVAGLWFSWMPHTNWAFAMLCMVNASIGLFGVRQLAGRYFGDERRELAVLLLLLTPFYTFFALRYNANTIFLSLWPWTAYTFVRAFESRSFRFAFLFGVLAAADILSKYFAAVLLGTCLIAALTHPDRRRYFRSVSPYVSVAVAAVLIAPHVWWLTQTGFMPFHYFGSETGHSLGFAIGQAAFVIAQGALQLSPVLFLLAGYARWPRFGDRPELMMLMILTLLPFVLTLAASIGFRLLLSDNTAGATFALLPMLLLALCENGVWRRAGRIAARVIAVGSPLAIAISPAIAFAQIQGESAKHMRAGPELAQIATDIWHKTCGCVLRFVAGDRPSADAIVFYGRDRSSELIRFNFSYSPWMTPLDVARHGLLIVCQNVSCMERAQAFGPAQTRDIEVNHSYGGVSVPPRHVRLFMVLPQTEDANLANAPTWRSHPTSPPEMHRSQDIGTHLAEWLDCRAPRAWCPGGPDGT